MIHGERDAYIGPDIARDLFGHAREPKETLAGPRREAQSLPGVPAGGLCGPGASISSAATPRAGRSRRRARRPHRLGRRQFADEPGFAMEPAKLISGVTATVTS